MGPPPKKKSSKKTKITPEDTGNIGSRRGKKKENSNLYPSKHLRKFCNFIFIVQVSNAIEKIIKSENEEELGN